MCETTIGGTPSRSNKKHYEAKILRTGQGLIVDSEEKNTNDAIENSWAEIFPKNAKSKYFKEGV